MKQFKDMKTMAFRMALLLSAAAAFAATDTTVVEKQTLAEKQTSLLEKLDSLNDAVLGLHLSGTIKAGVLSSTASSDQMANNVVGSQDSPERENQAYTDANLVIIAQPSDETRIHLEARLHKDWQDGYESGINPVIGHWFSYDGLILNKKVAFNLGYMRVGYTPLTLYVPQTNILYEPTIFTQRRVDALAERNLDTTSDRLLQGLNAEYNSGNLGVLSNLKAQATVARMRNIAKKADEVFFDFDWSDRYLIAGRVDVDAFGANIGANYAYTFDRRLSTRSQELSLSDTIYYDDNTVFSVDFGYDSDKQLKTPIHFGLTGEAAMSNWKLDQENATSENISTYTVYQSSYPDDDALSPLVYVKTTTTKESDIETTGLFDEDGSAWNIQPYVGTKIAGLDVNITGTYLQNDENFWSGVASSSYYDGNTSILNDNAVYDADSSLLSNFRSGNLENMYFSVYNTYSSTQQTIMSSGTFRALSGNSDNLNSSSQLYNNYKLAHYYRNGYRAYSLTKVEALAAAYLMDPSINLALPYGLATPDRSGFGAHMTLNFKDFVKADLRYSQYEVSSYDNTFTTITAGLGLDVGRMLGLSRILKIEGSYEGAEESDYLKRSSSRIVAGGDFEIWGPVSLLAGYQMLEKKYDSSTLPLVVGSAIVKKVEESLLLIGPKIKISPASYLSLQYGLLTNSVSYDSYLTGSAVPTKLDIDKSILMAEVRVSF